ncbi:hypothetical protein, partial [Haematospirillum sp. H1815]|uniref:hypothetical protein n=1 Tax=Haematospirillum sp. H1815 TaxID=2723108 RepID=UPI001ADEBE38
ILCRLYRNKDDNSMTEFAWNSREAKEIKCIKMTDTGRINLHIPSEKAMQTKKRAAILGYGGLSAEKYTG